MTDCFAKRSFMFVTGVIDRRIGWARLPAPLGLFVLSGIRMTLRRSNLFDPAGLKLPFGPSQAPDEPRSRVRSPDGKGNNLSHPSMGGAGTIFGRNVPVADTYPEDVLEPSPRLVSSALLSRKEFVPAERLNVLAAAWLQFQIHDWLSHETPNRADPWRVSLLPDDPWPEDPMLIPRTPRADTTDGGPPTYRNTETHWWDGSQLYGSSRQMQRKLRSFKGGRMVLSLDGLVPLDPVTGQDLAGVTGNWWVGLAMMHTLFLKEHNAICDMLATQYPAWSDDALFEHARLVNVALMAKIQTIEWSMAVVDNPTMRIALPANWWGLVGRRFTTRFGRISNRDEISGVPGSPTDFFGVPYAMTEEFVAVYRMHPLLPDDYQIRSRNDDSVIADLAFPKLALRRAREVLNEVAMPDLLYSFGISNPGAIVLHNFPRHLQHFEKLDGSIIDLGTTEILRDRERGVPRYNEFRRRFHLSPAKTFDDFSDDLAVVSLLRRVYPDPESVDLMVGLYAETPPPGFAFSDTAFRIFILMATRRLKSDRFFTYDYRPEVYTPEGLRWVADNTMATVLLRHYPDLAAPLSGVHNAFRPWRTTTTQ